MAAIAEPASRRDDASAAPGPAAPDALDPASTSGVTADGTLPLDLGMPRPRVKARAPLTEDSLVGRGGLEPASADATTASRLLHAVQEDSRRHALHLKRLAAFHVAEDDFEREEHTLAVAIALRTTTDKARRLILDAHIAYTEMPRTLERLARGEMPVEWHERMLRATRDMTPFRRGEIDERIGAWDLASIPSDRFFAELRTLVAWCDSHDAAPDPVQSRCVELEKGFRDDGTASLRITGPIPEILAVARRLDSSARSVQAAQRHAVRDGAPIPFDLDDAVTTTGRALSLATLRYAIITRTVLDTAGVEVPAPRYRVNVTVPALTMMGLADTPATFDGRTPIPAKLARDLAAAEPVWHRVLTDPVTGEFLPLPAERYTPTPAMVEHLRLRNASCAVPGCTRSTTDDAETDHIHEFDHEDPARGGPTHLANLHRLHFGHHDLKTAGHIDPVRHPDGTTEWTVGSPSLVSTRVAPDRDLATPEMAGWLMEQWDIHRADEDWKAMVACGEVDRLMREWGPVYEDFGDPPGTAELLAEVAEEEAAKKREAGIDQPPPWASAPPF